MHLQEALPATVGGGDGWDFSLRASTNKSGNSSAIKSDGLEKKEKTILV